MRMVATAFVGADDKRIYATVSEAEYQKILGQLEAEDYDAFAKMEFKNDDGTVAVGTIVPLSEFLDAYETAKAGEAE